MGTQILLAAAVVTAYGVLCWACFRRTKTPQLSNHGGLIIGFASQGGEAEHIALQHAKVFATQGPVAALPLNQITPELLSKTQVALFIVSTYGEGEPPDNALRFNKHWLSGSQGQDLAHLNFSVLALGDSSYRYFCGFAKTLTKGLEAHGAHCLFSPTLVDCLAPTEARQKKMQHWQQQLVIAGIADDEQQLIEGLNQTTESNLTKRLDLRLSERKLLNPGSQGGPIFQLKFTSAQLTQHLDSYDQSIQPLGSQPLEPNHQHTWQAGDIAGVLLPGSEDLKREYSIASVPDDGFLELLVRQVQKNDGSLGLGSGYLTDTLEIGTPITITIRENTGFHAPETEQPMILIGNGTGIAGLKAHLRKRELEGNHHNWLIFGERTRQCDCLFEHEFNQLKNKGVLPFLDRVYSREGEPFTYVQHLLAARAQRVCEWVESGAVIYVCGSQQSMAPAVHRVLVDILGEHCLEALILNGRYRRDIY